MLARFWIPVHHKQDNDCGPSNRDLHLLFLYFKLFRNKPRLTLRLVLLLLAQTVPRSNRKTRIVSAASAVATASAESCPAGSRSCIRTTPRSPPSASCPLPAPVRIGPCSNGGCAYRNPWGPDKIEIPQTPPN